MRHFIRSQDLFPDFIHSIFHGKIRWICFICNIWSSIIITLQFYLAYLMRKGLSVLQRKSSGVGGILTLKTNNSSRICQCCARNSLNFQKYLPIYQILLHIIFIHYGRLGGWGFVIIQSTIMFHFAYVRIKETIFENVPFLTV